jgi:hypothetical protein
MLIVMIMKRERNWKSFFGILGLSLMVVLVSCDDDDRVEAEVFDRDEAFNEFNETTFFNDNDVDDDALFDDNEFNQGFFDAFDLNDNDFIEEDELVTSRETFGANTTTTFADLDANADARLDVTEFEPDFDTNDFFGEFDADVNNSINPREFSDGVFVRWDVDNDGFIEANTFNTRFDRHF